ncbi:MAG: hypothetical protein JWR52_1057 [Marmoricola sp.]|nr:hypothetical protein [Marmoricola sp.]
MKETVIEEIVVDDAGSTAMKLVEIDLIEDDKNVVKKIKIFINEVEYKAPKPVMTGAELKALADIAVENQLFLDEPGHHDDPQIFDDEEFQLKSGMKFYDVPVGNLGAR